MSMFGSTVDGFSECFTVSQKLSQATCMCYFLPSDPAWLLLDSTAWQGSVEACSASTQSRALCLLPVLGFPAKCLRTQQLFDFIAYPKIKTNTLTKEPFSSLALAAARASIPCSSAATCSPWHSSLSSPKARLWKPFWVCQSGSWKQSNKVTRSHSLIDPTPNPFGGVVQTLIRSNNDCILQK